MHCPHCLTSYKVDVSTADIGWDKDYTWQVHHQVCPACNRKIVFFAMYPKTPGMQVVTRLAYPKGVSRKPIPPEVPSKIAEDYHEACLVLTDSPKASAALSRRCLQIILREHANVKPQDLRKEIDEVLASKQLPTYVAENIDAIRQVGNFAAHPIKATNSGAIVEVEPGEAEWSLDVLEELFDHYFVGPAQAQKKRDALNAKLAESRKPPLKTP